MGCCNSINSKSQHNLRNSQNADVNLNNNSRIQSNNHQGRHRPTRPSGGQILEFDIEPFLQARRDPEFNFPELDDNTYVGEGLKRMKGYISTLKEEELLRKREDFWGTRIEGNEETWKFLHYLCESNCIKNDDIEASLNAVGIIAYNNCINITYDDHGGVYEIPNYCIHMPSKYDLPEDHKQKPEEKNVVFICKNTEVSINCNESNYLSVEKLKAKIGEDAKVNRGVDKIRLFFGGKEMSNDKEIWFYNVSQGSIVLLMVCN